MVDAIIVPITTCACEGWPLNKEDKNKLQTIFNEAFKKILYLPNSTPTMILLVETGNIPIKYTIMKKQILHAKRIDSMQTETLIKDINKTGQSEWRKQVMIWRKN